MTTPKLLASAGVKVRLAAAGLAFLVLGALSAPSARQSTLQTPAARPTPLLVEQAQQREAAAPFRGVSEIADVVRTYGVAVLPPDGAVSPVWSDYARAARPAPPAGFGVWISASQVMTHARALGGRLTLRVTDAEGQTFEAAVAAYDVPTDLVLLDVRDAQAVPARIAAVPAAAGALGAGVVRYQGRDLVLPMFFAGLEDERYSTSGESTFGRPGLPVFNIDGDLVAVAAGDAAAREAVAAGRVAGRLIAQAAQGLRPSLGLALQPIPPAVRSQFGDAGVLVASVVPGGPADAAGVSPGQILLSVGDQPVGNVDEVASVTGSLAIGRPARLALAAGRRRVTLDVTPASVYEVASLSRRGAGEVTGVPAADLLDAADLAGAGIPADALVVGIDGRPVTSAAQGVRERRRARRPYLVHLHHDGVWFFAGVGAAP